DHPVEPAIRLVPHVEISSAPPAGVNAAGLWCWGGVCAPPGPLCTLVAVLQERRQFLEQLSLALIEVLRDVDVDAHVQIAVLILAAQAGHPLATQADKLARLGARVDLERHAAVHRRDIDLPAKHSGVQVDGRVY